MPKLLVHDIDRTYLVDVRPDETVTVGRARDCDVPLVVSNHADVQPIAAVRSPSSVSFAV